MTRTATARRLATGAATYGGGLGLAGAAFYALLREEARSARRRVEARTSKDDPPSGDGGPIVATRWRCAPCSLG